MTCSMAECTRKAKWRGLCQRHYIEDQYSDKQPPTDIEIAERIFPKIIENPDTNCWEWQGAGHARTGHGMFGYNALGRNITRYVHDWMWEFLVGPVPEGLVLDHLCRVTKCCNPEHLEPVTDRINNLRGESMAAKNAQKTHCKRGHEFTPENTRISQGQYGPQRNCRACGREKKNAQYRRMHPEPRGLKSHCKRGHPLSGDNLRVYGNQRHCKTCRRDGQRARRATY